MHIIYRCSSSPCDCIHIRKGLLVEYTDFGMSNVGYMVVKIRRVKKNEIR